MKKKKLDSEVDDLEEKLEEKLKTVEDKLEEDLKRVEKKLKKLKPGIERGSVANIYKGQAALICGRNYPANAINCL